MDRLKNNKLKNERSLRNKFPELELKQNNYAPKRNKQIQ